MAHSNLFIPSTLLVSNLSSNGGVDETQLKKNLNAATDVYVNSVQPTCAGQTVLMVKGSQSDVSENFLNRRDNLNVYLNGSKQEKCDLQRRFPNDCEYFKNVYMGYKEQTHG